MEGLDLPIPNDEVIDAWIKSMLDDLLVGDDNVDDYHINVRTNRLLALQQPAESDIVTADNIIKISNILFNNTDRMILPLDDGMYDLLMVWIQRYKEDYQVELHQPLKLIIT